jgi:hypothetical protein
LSTCVFDDDGRSRNDVPFAGIDGEDEVDGPLDTDAEDDDACSDACEPCLEWL